MATNDEIKEKYAYELRGVPNPDTILNEACADTAKRIFADLREIITLFPNSIDELDIKVIFPESDKFRAIESKYGVYK